VACQNYYMRLGFLLVVLAVLPVSAQETPLTVLPYTPSLDTQFMDRSADPCADFYKYACGNWNKLNPIPADQARWDVYAKLTDENQRCLWGILEQAAKPNPPRTTNEQKIGDFFHACMDEGAVNRAGDQPLEAMLTRIANLKSVNDIAAYVAEEHKNGVDRSVLFGFDSNQDFDNSSQVIAFAEVGGLGLPDRDYYIKTDPKSQEIRQKYVQHIQQILQLIGESAPDARADARAVMTIETGLAQASLTRVEKRNPYNLKHKISRDELRQMLPAFDWDTYLDKAGVPEFHDLNVTEPKFFAQLNNELTWMSDATKQRALEKLMPL
jgi:putative endopeptidase